MMLYYYILLLGNKPSIRFIDGPVCQTFVGYKSKGQDKEIETRSIREKYVIRYTLNKVFVRYFRQMNLPLEGVFIK